MNRNTQIDKDTIDYYFPDVSHAMAEPNGLLASGGDLSPGRLLAAYRKGIFPWYSGDEPILWWSPDPRSILFPSRIKISRSLKKSLKKDNYEIKMDTAFDQVIHACAQPRNKENGTWITDDMIAAYCHMHELGHAHSIETWQYGQLVGGLYGMAIGRVFFGESMFHLVRDASKLALVHLAQKLESWDYPLIDCQVGNPHLSSMGAEDIPRTDFIKMLDQWCTLPGIKGLWHNK